MIVGNMIGMQLMHILPVVGIWQHGGPIYRIATVPTIATPHTNINVRVYHTVPIWLHYDTVYHIHITISMYNLRVYTMYNLRVHITIYIILHTTVHIMDTIAGIAVGG